MKTLLQTLFSGTFLRALSHNTESSTLPQYRIEHSSTIQNRALFHNTESSTLPQYRIKHSSTIQNRALFHNTETSTLLFYSTKPSYSSTCRTKTTQECLQGLHQVIHHNGFPYGQVSIKSWHHQWVLPMDGFPSSHGTNNGFSLQKGFHQAITLPMVFHRTDFHQVIHHNGFSYGRVSIKSWHKQCFLPTNGFPSTSFHRR